MAIFNENGGLVSAGVAVSAYSAESAYSEFDKLDSMIAESYYNVMGSFDTVEMLAESGLVSLNEGVKEVLSAAWNKIVDLWQEATNALSRFVNKIGLSGKEKQVKEAFAFYKKESTKNGFKASASFRKLLEEFGELPTISISDLIEKNNNALNAYSTAVSAQSSASGDGSNKYVYAAAIGKELVGGTLYEDDAKAKKMIDDELFAPGASPSTNMDDIYRVAMDTNKDIAACRKCYNTAKKAANAVFKSDAVLVGPRYAVSILTYCTGKTLSIVKKKVTLSGKICMNLISKKFTEKVGNYDKLDKNIDADFERIHQARNAADKEKNNEE